MIPLHPHEINKDNIITAQQDVIQVFKKELKTQRKENRELEKKVRDLEAQVIKVEQDFTLKDD